MKIFFKLGCLSIVGLIALIIVIGVSAASCGGGSASGGSVPATTTQKAEPAKKSEPAKKAAPATITKSNYDKIKIGDALNGKGGMSIAQVKAILGKPMEHTTSDSTFEGQKTTLDIYDWQEGFTKTITVDFTNGHASGKTQVGLSD